MLLPVVHTGWYGPVPPPSSSPTLSFFVSHPNSIALVKIKYPGKAQLEQKMSRNAFENCFRWRWSRWKYTLDWVWWDDDGARTMRDAVAGFVLCLFRIFVFRCGINFKLFHTPNATQLTRLSKARWRTEGLRVRGGWVGGRVSCIRYGKRSWGGNIKPKCRVRVLCRCRMQYRSRWSFSIHQQTSLCDWGCGEWEISKNNFAQFSYSNLFRVDGASPYKLPIAAFPSLDSKNKDIKRVSSNKYMHESFGNLLIELNTHAAAKHTCSTRTIVCRPPPSSPNNSCGTALKCQNQEGGEFEEIQWIVFDRQTPFTSPSECDCIGDIIKLKRKFALECGILVGWWLQFIKLHWVLKWRGGEGIACDVLALFYKLWDTPLGFISQLNMRYGNYNFHAIRHTLVGFWRGHHTLLTRRGIHASGVSLKTHSSDSLSVILLFFLFECRKFMTKPDAWEKRIGWTALF